MTRPTLQPATEAEFNTFREGYPRALTRAAHGVYEPPIVTFNDWTLGEWPESVVALYRDDQSGPRDFEILAEEQL